MLAATLLLAVLTGAAAADPGPPLGEIVLVGLGGKHVAREADRHLHAAWRCGLKKAYLRPERVGDFPKPSGSSVVLAVPRERSRYFYRHLACYDRQPEIDAGILA